LTWRLQSMGGERPAVYARGLARVRGRELRGDGVGGERREGSVESLPRYEAGEGCRSMLRSTTLPVADSSEAVGATELPTRDGVTRRGVVA
jgi:hypothetical protein